MDFFLDSQTDLADSPASEVWKFFLSLMYIKCNEKKNNNKKKEENFALKITRYNNISSTKFAIKFNKVLW
jgi:hypothetical protein